MSTTKTKTKRINSNLLYEKLLTNDKKKLTINEADILNKRILELKGDIKYSEFQLKYVSNDKKALMKKVLSLINADIKHATQLKIKYKNSDNSVIQIRVEKQSLIKIYKRCIVKEPRILSVDAGTEFKDEFKAYCDKNNRSACSR